MKKSILVILVTVSTLILANCASTTNRESTGQYLDSAAVTAKVKANLADALGLKTLKTIDVSTYKGVVQLSGFVKSQKEIDEAVAVTKKIAGVQSVENSLIIKKDIK
jgi:osmotically-inducible protein OsmY